MTVFWAQAETHLTVVMVGSSYTELLANADFHLFLFVQICGATGVLSAFCSRKGGIPTVGKVPTIKMSSGKSFTGRFYSWRANVNFQTVALADCLYWDEFDIKGPHLMKKFLEKLHLCFASQ